MALDNTRDLTLRGMQAMYNAERQQLEAYPGTTMDTPNEPAAREGLQAHIDETKAHSERLERIFSGTGEEPSDPGVMDPGFVAALQMGQHYEIAAYGSLRTYAETMGMGEAAELLQRTLDEEKAEDERLTELAVQVANPRAQE